MFGIDAVNIFDGKIVNDKEECNRTGGMTETARCVLDWRVVGKCIVLLPVGVSGCLP